ncbi:AP-5 complex subunit zeta-1 [Saguinus oedipus]|uniref:AP-5 complex subunit zeta-1 n=1 Tax=Saguinus oedipus TaxID=9490 RepID=A0ABQ9W610_SAGOE|nr:AP-5 complex subunit zeta-1 [Saguinus oedipus]
MGQYPSVCPMFDLKGDRNEEVRAVGQGVLRALESRQPEGPSLRHLLPVMAKVVVLSPGTLQEGTWGPSREAVRGLPSQDLTSSPHATPPAADQTTLLSKRLVDWLRYASLQQGFPHSGSFFSTPRARQPGPITEVDGAVATDFFTVLSTGHHFTEDQWLNVQGFSMLRVWLLHSGPESPGALDTGVLGMGRCQTGGRWAHYGSVEGDTGRGRGTRCAQNAAEVRAGQRTLLASVVGVQGQHRCPLWMPRDHHAMCKRSRVAV